MEELITIRDMCKIYNPGENEVRALDHVDLVIHKNEFVAIIGQSGSGKSTLMNMPGCLDVPSSGTYLLNGKDVSHMSDDELSDIRNREIGIRKALGARTRSILLQFLAEAGIITLLGGVIGIVSGILGAMGICSIAGVKAGIEASVVLLATLFSCGVGIFFGIYPAKKAAKLSPIEALRHE